MRAPTSCFLRGWVRLCNTSVTGITKANVFPLPVVASTQTSLFFINKGIVARCTGVICSNPNTDSIVSNERGDKAGCRELKSKFDFILNYLPSVTSVYELWSLLVKVCCSGATSPSTIQLIHTICGTCTLAFTLDFWWRCTWLHRRLLVACAPPRPVL